MDSRIIGLTIISNKRNKKDEFNNKNEQTIRRFPELWRDIKKAL